MEDTETGDVVGTSGIEATVGLDDAFYHYHLGTVVHASRELKVHNTVDILTLCNDYTGGIRNMYACSCAKAAREGNNGRLCYPNSVFLFMMEHQERFAETIIAEMRGVSDDEGCFSFLANGWKITSSPWTSQQLTI